MIFLFLISLVFAQDPAPGWMGYCTANNPNGIVTFIEAYWNVGQNPVEGGAFFSPWFGIETSDNLNLVQPVNPWLGDSWAIYNEYFQWSPVNNVNSDSHIVQPGDVLYGRVVYNNKTQSYDMYHSDLNDGWSVSMSVPIQQDQNGNYKKYQILYFVMEKSQWDCDQYPPDNQVIFYNISVQYNYKPWTPNWTTGVVDDNCNCRCNVINPRTLKITWNSQDKKSIQN